MTSRGDAELFIPAPIVVESPLTRAATWQWRRMRFRILPVALGILVGGLVVVGALTLWGARHDDGPGVASGTAHRGWIFHEVERITVVRQAGAGRYANLTEERWTLNAPPYRTRQLTYPFFAAPRVEMGSSRHGSLLYDPTSDALYQGDADLSGEKAADPARYYRESLASGALKVKGKATIDGHAVLRLEPPIASGTIAFVNAKTFRPIEVRSPGLPLVQPSRKRSPCGFMESDSAPPSTTVLRTVTYEYLPPTRDNLKLLDVEAQHRGAPVLPAAKVPKAFVKKHSDPCGGIKPLGY